ncbi:MAG: bifunctional 2-polyprenyl-6-hydroxyphenol methylase/3-demethylubiquinol 3-O-methyltransferase UbiG [Gammaproteobacteria bacterium]|nr:bifunctional 2-polyprenyl-6-hydroxyphenol methylase/3-demethylubiquinol 3-O-methyltransferase UbiG [Gammaproteobacteria bacterium]
MPHTRVAEAATGPLEPRNVDPEEAARYAALASTWWDQSGPFWPLHRLNTLRVDYLRPRLARVFDRDPDAALPLQGLRVLDVGCGGGILSEAMARLGAEVHGIDVVQRNIEIARLHARQSSLAIRYDLEDVESLARAGSRYDIVLNMEVVEHVPDVSRFMKACAALVNADGVMVLATINRTPRSWLFAIVGAEYVLGWLPRGTHRWDRFVRPSELQQMLRAAGLATIERSGVRINPLTRRFSLGRSLAVNYMLIASREVSPP